MPATSAALLDQANLPDHHLAVRGLEHVVDREGRRRDRRQRFHLDAGLRGRARGRRNAVSTAGRRDVHVDVAQRNRVTERDDLAGALRGHDARKPCGLERVALTDLAAAYQTLHGRAHRDLTPCYRLTCGDRLGADIHHPQAARRIHVGQPGRPRCHRRSSGHWSPCQAEGFGGVSPRARKNERLSSETVRSTLFSFTSGGTLSAPGEKFRIALIPAATTRSMTGCAADAGPAITPMLTRS